MRNPLCPPEVLAEAQSHEVADVRASVAMHPRATPTEVLDVLASDPETDTRCLVASHPNSRLRTLDFMLEDARAKGRKMASNCLEAARMAEGAIPIEVLVAANLKLRREVALRTHQTDTVQASLARDADAGVRILLASSRGVGVAWRPSMCWRRTRTLPFGTLLPNPNEPRSPCWSNSRRTVVDG